MWWPRSGEKTVKSIEDLRMNSWVVFWWRGIVACIWDKCFCDGGDMPANIQPLIHEPLTAVCWWVLRWNNSAFRRQALKVWTFRSCKRMRSESARAIICQSSYENTQWWMCTPGKVWRNFSRPYFVLQNYFGEKNSQNLGECPLV